MAAPVQAAYSPTYARTEVWGHGLFGCFDDLTLCIISYFVPCVTFGQTAESLGKSCIIYGIAYLFWPCNWYLETLQRGQIREIRGIPGTGFRDCCIICWCPLCTLVQEAQEVKDMQEGNITARTVVVTTTTVTPGSDSGSGTPEQKMVRA